MVEGGNAISGIPAERWDADDYYHPDPLTPGHMTTKWGAFVADIAGFDAEFFGITPREAASMDPQQRMLLEVTWEALEHAGIPTESLAGTRTAVMMGVYFNEYQSMLASSRENVDAYTGTGNSHSITAGRISYLLGLRGPAAAIDTACSSSLSAIHLACQSLRLRETDLALAGGVSATLRPETQIAISAWGLLSPEGRCATFDAAADGFVRGEGAGVVVLKRLTDALRDQNQILAVVRGSAVNQDGRSNGITAPNTAAQCDVIADALRSADVAPESVHYVETHGTGTQLGDPIEFEALAATYGLIKGQDGYSCALGAVKTNIGHLEAASGVAGFIKAVLAVQHGQIPRTCTSHNGIRPSTRHRRGFSFRSTTLLGRQIRVHDGRRFPPSAWAGRMRMQSSSRVRNCRQPAGAAPTMRSRRWWWRVRRRRGWLRRPGCWPIGWRARAPRWR
ncbi:beta-ketoacyl synthase, C-terminal domain protein [Mycobacterium ulcerans str. Harvey]|uniref:Beta-ketoacyl synthase, C-terminal domain protein n=1 Tax=Mycobacterium ulcerans str. Harvey TaxID=1299332 RepID=A0ABN0R0J5_MYCUL|nr:beta-ketoacyl synthase, C-terminal domain protein [Mycobacterium ulcerans str. Harvey]